MPIRFVKRTAGKLILPIQDFFKSQEMSGLSLIFATIVSMILANSSLNQYFHELWFTKVVVDIGGIKMGKDLHFFVNEGLMTVFFIVVGLEIKREVIAGALSTFRKAILPVIAALGGMFFPAVIYFVFNVGTPSIAGWGIPTATDIAFSLMVIGLLGKKVPLPLTIFLATLAIADDLGAILVIALFYGSSISWFYFLLALLVVVILLLMNRLNVADLRLYGLAGVLLWYFTYKTGIHPTISGVVLAFFVPFRLAGYEENFHRKIDQLVAVGSQLSHSNNHSERLIREQLLDKMRVISKRLESPLQNLVHFLHPVSAYFVMPVFAFVNAGIVINTNAFQGIFSPLGLGIVLGLALGKSGGIYLATRLAVWLRLGIMPEGVSWMGIYGVAWLGGIGFTMSMFVSGLAFKDVAMMETARLSIIAGSLISGIIGYTILKLLPKEKKG